MYERPTWTRVYDKCVFTRLLRLCCGFSMTSCRSYFIWASGNVNSRAQKPRMRRRRLRSRWSSVIVYFFFMSEVASPWGSSVHRCVASVIACHQCGGHMSSLTLSVTEPDARTIWSAAAQCAAYWTYFIPAFLYAFATSPRFSTDERLNK